MIYHVFANRSNIGDWLSAKGIQKLLHPLPFIECLCDEPFVEETISVLSKATEKDLVVIGGGGLLMDYFIPFWKAFIPLAERIPFCIWGIGYCDLKNEPSLPPNNLIEQIINKSKLCIVRDELTRSYLPNCNLPSPVPCPSINVVEQLPAKGNDLLHVVNYTTAGAGTYDEMCIAAKIFANESGRIYRETNNLIVSGNEKELAKILSLYERSGIVISSALHGCIIGVAMGLKVLAVSGDRKIEGFMGSVGLQQWVLDTTEVKQVTEKLNNIHEQINQGSILHSVRNQNLEIASSIKVIAGLL